jgi:hypothetical protein
LAIEVDSSDCFGSSRLPPTAISVLYELMKPNPSLLSLPESARSCVYGGSSIWKLFAMSMRPVSASIFIQHEAPR